ncbi:hypothetical protein EMCG_07900 [[Emmonsia] crescens]|uniref:Uncharacterized protein n=1 Tax=[Emmonsia] crescens TaxID=73230 RepID=A0A0G2JAV6_9EURO|nr:hypothetical protein EMCG_07900 [Emmonsia crescens UAMH 3008]
MMTLKSLYFNKTTAEIIALTNIFSCQINCIYERALVCRFNSHLSHLILCDE